MPRRRVQLILPALLVLVASIAPQPVTAASRHATWPVGGRLVANTQVRALDTRFDPTVPHVSRGGTVVFNFVGLDTHAAADDLLGLYDSGNVPGGGPSATYTFVAAGIYPFTCVLHIDQGMAGRVHVPMQASPAKGSLKSTFTLTWASVEATTGFAYDVRLKRPDRAWSGWRSSVSVRKATYQAHSGKGVYRFRARLRRTDTGDVSLWSDAVTITVG